MSVPLQVSKDKLRSGVMFFGSLCASTFGLGCWQSKRYFEKIDMIAKRVEELNMPMKNLESNAQCFPEEQVAIPVQPLIPSGNNNVDNAPTLPVKREEFRSTSIEGKFRHDDELLMGPRGPPLGAISKSGPNSGRSAGGMSSSPQGYFVLTPLERTNGEGTVVVNRGWVPRQYVKEKVAWDRPGGIIKINGIPSKTEKPRWLSPPHNEKEPRQLLWMDRLEIEMKTHTLGLSPMLLTEIAESAKGPGSDTVSFPVKPHKENVGEFKVSPATHMGYGITWFSLSGAGIIMTRKIITKGRF